MITDDVTRVCDYCKREGMEIGFVVCPYCETLACGDCEDEHSCYARMMGDDDE